MDISLPLKDDSGNRMRKVRLCSTSSACPY